MAIEQLPTGIDRVMSVGAHPDDNEFSAGGTLASLANQGTEVTLVVCTDGGKGGRGVANIVEVRQQEQAAAVKALGASDCINLGYPDGDLKPIDELRDRLIELIRLHRPQIVFTHHPQNFFKFYGKTAYMGHSDHRATGVAVMDAVYPRAGSPNFCTGLGGEPWSPPELWLFDGDNADHLVDISSGLANKVAALEAHVSQNGETLAQAASRLASYIGSANQPAEAFMRLPLAL